MVRIYTLGQEEATNTSIVGYRASDIAKIAQAKYTVPLSFIISCSLFDEFLDASGIRARLLTIYQNEPQTIDGYTRAYKALLELFHQVKFSQLLKEELLEAYDSLAIPNSSAVDLVADNEDPTVILIPSPNYLVTPDRLRGVRQNITGKEAFLAAIKDCWASFFLPEKVMERQHYGIAKASTGIIVQQQLPVEGSAEGHYRHKEASPIHVVTYLGSLDIFGEITKDEFSIAAEHLQINNKIIKEQQTKLITGDEPGIFLERSVGYMGVQQSLNDRQVLEVARLTKRAHVILGEDINTFFSVNKEEVILLFVLRDHQEIVQQVESYGERTIDESLPETFVEESTLSVPEQLQEQEVSIITDETAAIPLEIVSEEEDQNEIELIAESSLQEEENDAEEPTEIIVDQPQTTMFNDDSKEEQLTSIHQQEDEEETLFDLFQQEQPQNTPVDMPVAQQSPQDTITQLITETFVKLEQKLVATYQENLQRQPEHFDELIETLRERQLLPFTDNDVMLITNAHLAIQQGQRPSDEALGVAWRLQQLL